MDNFREWVSDNLRYIILIAFIAVIVIAAFFGIKALNNRRAANEETAAVSEESTVESTTEALTPSEDSEINVPETAETNDLKENEPAEVAALVTDYYAALSEQDISKITGLVDFLSDDDAANIVTGEKTQFSDVTAYVKNGPVPDSYVTYAYYKYSNSEVSDIPGLSQLYIIKNDAGDLVVKSDELTAEEQAFVDDLNTDPKVQELIYRVQREYENATMPTDDIEEAAEASEPAQEESAEQAPQETQEAAPAPAENSEPEAAPQQANTTRTSTIVSDCNVRSAPSYDGSVLGVITGGTEVTVYGEADNGWYHISGGGLDGYVGYSFVN